MNVTSAYAPSYVLNSVDVGQFAVDIISEDKAIERKSANTEPDTIYAQIGAVKVASCAGMLSGTAE